MIHLHHSEDLPSAVEFRMVFSILSNVGFAFVLLMQHRQACILDLIEKWECGIQLLSAPEYECPGVFRHNNA